MLRGSDPPFAAVLEVAFHGVLRFEGLEGFVDVCVDELVDFGRFHVGDCANGEFAGDFGRDDGFGARRGEGAFDAVEAEGRVAPAAHERAFFVRVDPCGAAEGFVEVVHGKSDVLVEALLFVCQGCDQFLDPWDEDVAVAVDEGGHYADEIGHWFLGYAAEDAAVEVLAGSRDLDAVVVAPS